MKTNDKKLNNGMKILGASLLFLAIPGSAIALPWIIWNYRKKLKKEPSKETVLGI